MNTPPFDVKKAARDLSRKISVHIFGFNDGPCEIDDWIKDFGHRCADAAIEKAAVLCDDKRYGNSTYLSDQIRDLKTRKGSEKENSK